ncbi:MAG: hypothetical protein ABL308_03115 [Oceanicaulis sp.]
MAAKSTQPVLPPAFRYAVRAAGSGVIALISCVALGLPGAPAILISVMVLIAGLIGALRIISLIATGILFVLGVVWMVTGMPPIYTLGASLGL